MLKYEGRTSLHAQEYECQPGSVLMFRSYYLKNGQPRHFVLLFCGTASLALPLTCSYIFSKIEVFSHIKLFL